MLRDVRRQRDKEWGTRGSVAQAGYRTMDKLVLGVLGEATPVFFFLLLSGCLRRYEFQNGAVTFALVQRVTALCRPNVPRRRVVHTQLSSVGFFRILSPCKHTRVLTTMNFLNPPLPARASPSPRDGRHRSQGCGGWGRPRDDGVGV